MECTRITGLVTLCFLALNVFAGKGVIIRGKVTHRLADSVSVTFNDNKIAYYPKEYAAALDKDGSFVLSFSVPDKEWSQVTLKHGNKIADIIVQDHDSLVVKVDGAHFDSTIHYSGRNSIVENFVAAHTLKIGRMAQYSMRLKEHIPKEPADFVKAIDKERAMELAYLEKNKKGLPTDFVRYWQDFYKYFNYFFLEQYPQVHEILKKHRFTDTIPDTNYTVIKQLPIEFNDSCLQLPSYLLYLTGALELKLKADGYTYHPQDSNKVKLFRDSVYKLVYSRMTKGSGEYYVAQSLYSAVKNQPYALSVQQYDSFKAHWPGSAYITLLNRQMAIAERIEPGQTAPDFDITLSTGETKKLSSYRGRVVYMQFWAAWCRQCVSEMIREQKVKDLMKNKPVTFLYVSLGNDTTSENPLIRKYKIDGDFCDVPNIWDAPVANEYGVQSLPAYFLIDEDGKIALRNPPSPNKSTEQILEIEKLFKHEEK